MKTSLMMFVVGLSSLRFQGLSFSPCLRFTRQLAVISPALTRHFAQGKGDDPTRSVFSKVINGLSQAVASSPLNEGKKAIARMVAGDYDKAAIRAKIESLIEEKPVLMLSFTSCPFCLKAKAVLDEKGAEYTAVELDTEKDGMKLRAEMAEMIGRTSVPAIWIGGNFIGGCNDGPTPAMGGVVKLNESGKLDEMLQAVGALKQ